MTKRRRQSKRAQAASVPPMPLLDRLRPLATALRSRDAQAAGAFFAAALVIRLWNLPDLGLTHFDEGPYALTGRMLVTAPGQFYSAALSNAYHAPPLFPWLCGAAFRLFGAVDYVTLLPSMIAGALTVALAYLIGWRADRRATGVWAAAIMAVCEIHIIYSRMALTDSLLTMWFALTVLLGIVAWQKDRWWLYLLPGAAAGLAMNTKYNGFLPLLLAAGFYVFAFAVDFGLGPLMHKDRRAGLARAAGGRAVRTGLIGIAGAAAVFVLLYAHWYLSVDKAMGYDKLMAHHRGYSLGLDRSLAKFKNDPAAMLVYFRMWGPALLFAPLGALAGLWRWRKEHVILYAWAAGLYAGLFLYTPYARLSMPLAPVMAILAGMLFSRAGDLAELVVGKIRKARAGESTADSPAPPRWPAIMHASLAAAFVVVGFARVYPTLALDTNSYRLAYQQIQKSHPPDKAVLVRDTLANFVFYIDRQAAYIMPNAPMAGLLRRPIPKVFVLDAHVNFNKERIDFVEANKDVLNLVTTIPNRRYEPHIWDPFNERKILEARRNPEKYHRDLNIDIFFTAEPCVIPASWPTQ